MSPSSRPVTPGQRLAFGAIALCTGAGIMAVGAGLFPSTLDSAHAPLWILLCAGATFALAGVSLLTVDRTPGWVQGLCACTIVTLFAAIAAFVALFGSAAGFSSSIDFLAAAFAFESVGIGRVAFGVVALLLALAAVMAWISLLRALPWTGRIALLTGVALTAWLLLIVVPAEPRWPELADDHQRLARYARLMDEEGWSRIKGREPLSWYFPPWRNFAHWTQAARSRLAAQRQAPDGQELLIVNASAAAPVIDGIIGVDEWRNARRVVLVPESLGSQVFIASDQRRLYLAADVPADTTEKGYDQFRFWFHLDLSPALSSERVFVGRAGDVTTLRTVRYPGAGQADRERTDWRIYEGARGASTMDGHRRFELAVDMKEAGIVPGVPFPAWLEIEGDPVLDANGKFRARTALGQAGSRAQALWLLVEKR